MTATPQYGVLVAKGAKTGMTYSVDFYISDVANALVNFDVGAGASSGSPDFITFPEPVVIEDIAVHTGCADTTKMRLVVNGVPTGNVFRYAIHLDTLSKRPQLRIGIKQGSRVSLLQLA